MLYNFKSAIEQIVEIEKRFDVNSLYCGDLQVWPLIRMQLYTKLCIVQNRKKKQTYQPYIRKLLSKKLRSIIKAPFNILKRVIYFVPCQRHLSSFRNKVPVDFLFYTKPNENGALIDGKVYNYLDPLIDLAEEQYKCLKIGLGNFKKKKNCCTPHFKQISFVNPGCFLNKIVSERDLQYHLNSIEGFDNLQKVILDVTGKVYLDKDGIIGTVNSIIRQQYIFESILLEAKPKVVFVVCFHGNTMSLIRACNKLKIKTVDVQHGVQGEYSPYSHWTKIPQNGYELLPDFFWCWGKESKENIEKWQPEGCTHHRPIIGGNRWLGKWIDNDEIVISDKHDPFFEKLEKADKTILVSLQHDNFIPDHLFEIMEKSQDNWFWLIRLHPLQKNQLKEVMAIIRNRRINNFEIENPTNYPLYSILKQVDYNLTCCSSTAFEALTFKVPTIIVHPSGLLLYKDFIERGIFSYAINADTLLKQLKETYSAERLRLTVPYIETDIRLAEEALDIILKHKETNTAFEG